MCLVLFAWQSHPRYALVLAANRDEFHERPAAPVAWWSDAPGVLAGRDLEAGGTWMGVNRGGRFAALTNYREPAAPGEFSPKSRGELVHQFLAEPGPPFEHANRVAQAGENYSGFNLLLGHRDEMAWVSNRGMQTSRVEPGIHGLSNHLLNTHWPKVSVGKEKLHAALASDEESEITESLFTLLTDRNAATGALPERVESGLTAEHLARHFFIVSPVYGTRCSSVILLGHDGTVFLEERRFDPHGKESGRGRFFFQS